MKRFCSLFLAALLLCCLWLPVLAEEADDAFDRSIRRFNDFSETVSEDEEAQLNAKVRDKISELRMDLPVCVFYTRKSETTLSEFAADYYERNKYGCGEDKSGVLLVVDTKNAKFDIYYYGEADTLIGARAREKLSDTFKAACHDGDLTWYDAFDRYYDAVFAMVEDARQHPDGTTAPQTRTDGEMPDWYPQNTQGFTDFHGENLAPVVDDAHLFTAEQFRTLSDRISAMNARLGIGYAAFTSNDNYGLTPEEYSSDFLHFNGYGVGDGYGAVVFYLSLDPDDRCWLTTSINTYEPLFNADVTYAIDEMVDSSIRSGEYYEAFVMHADYVEKLFSDMSENLPAWYPEGVRTYEIDRSDRSYGASADAIVPRSVVADNAAFLSETQEQTASDALRALSEQYGLDLVIFTDTAVRAPEKEQYADDFYYYNGCGADGICLYLFDDGGSRRYGTLYYGSGTQYEKLNITQKLSDAIREDAPDQAIEQYIGLLTFMLKHNRLPMSKALAGFCLVIGLVAGLIVAAVVVGKLKGAMAVSQTVGAYTYLVDGTFRLISKRQQFLYADVSRKAKPKPSESSSGSSGSSRGGSSFTSGHSAGGSYSSGGRRF